MRQTVTLAVQTWPEELNARAVILSLPVGLAILRSTLKEPLGAFVVAFVETTTLPSRRIVTVQITPLRF